MINSNIRYKKAFSMVTAIFVIFIMSSLTALIMGISSKTVKSTTQQYQKEQASLLARSYTELAILYAMDYNRSGGSCLERINASFGEVDNLYSININIKYIGNKNSLLDCPANITRDSWDEKKDTGFNAVVSMVVDVYISYKDFDDPTNRDITFHRRTVQKL
jgi:competence protein ComGC